MWICFNDGFVSAVEHIDDPTMLVVRARRIEILKRLFPEENVIVGGSVDYKYRVYVDKKSFAALVVDNIMSIDYPNFKDSVEEKDLADMYGQFWLLHSRYQR